MGFNVRRFRNAADLFQQLGLDGGAVVDQLASQGHGPEALAALSAHYAGVSGFGPHQLRELLQNGVIAPNRLAPTPRGLAPAGYAAPDGAGFPIDATGLQGELARFFAGDPFARQQLERALGGRIVPGGVTSRSLRVEPFTTGSTPQLGPATANAMGSNLLNQFAPNDGGYLGAVNRGLANVVGSGGGTGSVLGDPALTVEDKVCLLLMLIMKQMDRQIEAQANYINALQQQQNAGGGKGGGGKGGGSSPSIDVETMKLKRLIDKRSQMFDMLRQIIDKYNETAKNIIQSIAR